MDRHPPQILLIDDDPDVLDSALATLRDQGMDVHAYEEASEALNLLHHPEAPTFDLVISDIHMPGLDGFDVLDRIKATHPRVPVMLMTGRVSADLAIRALRQGAANLILKPIAFPELVQNAFHLVDIHRGLRAADESLLGMVNERRHYLFRSDELDVPTLVRHLTDRLVPMGFATASNEGVIAMAYHEALVNALEHGNLELDSSLKQTAFTGEDAWGRQRAERLADPGYASRLIEVKLALDTERLDVEITDEGPGYDTSIATRVSGDWEGATQFGRGLPLILLIMDEVHFNDDGNQIRMVLRKK